MVVVSIDISRLQEIKLFATTIAQTVCDGSLFPVAEDLISASRGSAAVFLLRRASHAEYRGQATGSAE
jgi:hypothetical protein